MSCISRVLAKTRVFMLETDGYVKFWLVVVCEWLIHYFLLTRSGAVSDNNATWLSELDVVLLSGFHEELYAWIRSEFACYRATKFRFYFSTTGAHFSPNLFLSQSSTGDVPRLSSTFLSCNFFFTEVAYLSARKYAASEAEGCIILLAVRLQGQI